MGQVLLHKCEDPFNVVGWGETLWPGSPAKMVNSRDLVSKHEVEDV